MALPLIVFFSLQRYFVRGLTAGVGEGLSAVRPRSSLAGIEPLSPQRKWRAITIATLVLVPAYWAMLAGLVAVASDDRRRANRRGPAIAFGLALLPFVFIALAFLSEHPRRAGRRGRRRWGSACWSASRVAALAPTR